MAQGKNSSLIIENEPKSSVVEKGKKSPSIVDKGKKIPLIIENEKNSSDFWGRIRWNEENLIMDSAPTLEELQAKLKTTLKNFHDVDPSEVSFTIYLDITALFREKDFLNLSSVAERAGINRSLLNQYANGLKYPSIERAIEIENVVHMMGNELKAVNIAYKGNVIPAEEPEVEMYP